MVGHRTWLFLSDLGQHGPWDPICVHSGAKPKEGQAVLTAVPPRLSPPSPWVEGWQCGRNPDSPFASRSWDLSPVSFWTVPWPMSAAGEHSSPSSATFLPLFYSSLQSTSIRSQNFQANGHVGRLREKREKCTVSLYKVSVLYVSPERKVTQTGVLGTPH